MELIGIDVKDVLLLDLEGLNLKGHVRWCVLWRMMKVRYQTVALVEVMEEDDL